MCTIRVPTTAGDVVRLLAATFPTTAGDVARPLAATQLDAYEAAARGVSELAWLTAKALPDPACTVTWACGDLARDVAAVQLSTARWILDL
jgi:hypothetical protein